MALGRYDSSAFTTDGGIAIAPSAAVEVRRESDGALASIFSDRAGTLPITQPGFVADDAGAFFFYAAGISQGYQVKVTAGAEVRTLNHQAVGLAKDFDIDEFWRSVLATATRLAARFALRAFGLDGTADRATNTILGALDSGKRFVATGSFTQTFDAAATLGADWHVHYRVSAGQTVTLDPNLAELIDGAATKVLVGPAAGYVVCDGTGFHTFGFENAPNASTTVRGVVELATQAEADAGTADRVPTTDLNKLALDTPVDLTNGGANDLTFVDFTVPAGARRVTINVADMSGNGTSNYLVQLGDSGGIENTGYSSAVGNQAGTTAGSTAGFIVTATGVAAGLYQGRVVLELLDAAAFKWTAASTISRIDAVTIHSAGGSKSLSAELTTVRLTTVNGTDLFDGGSMNIITER